MSRQFLLLAASLALACPGCTSVGRVKIDQECIRTALLDLYTSQVMDNLVRAVNGLPIIQLDYTNANAQVTTDFNGTASESLGVNRSTTVTALTRVTTLIARTATNTLMGNLGLYQTNQVGVTATPVLTSNEVYDAYLRYLAELGSLRVTDCPPPQGAAHVSACFRNRYYWVPVEFAPLFFELATITTAQRGKALLPSDDFYRVNIVGFVDDKQVKQEPNENGVYTVAVVLDQALPAPDTGFVEIYGKLLTLNSYPDPTGKSIEYKAKRWQIELNPRKTPPGIRTPADLVFPIPAKASLTNKPYQQPTTKELLDRIPFETPQVSLSGQSPVPVPSVQASPAAVEVHP